MSYARFSAESDVYVFLHVGGALCCCGCFNGEGYFDTTAEMVAHLREHEARGDRVPACTIKRLEADADENDAWMANEKKEQ